MFAKKYLSIRKSPVTSLKLWMMLLLFLFLMTGWSIAAVKDATSTTPFTIAVIPDSQNMVAGNMGGTPTMFYNQVKWIKDNISALNIKFVSQVGDLVNNSGSSTQWTSAVNAMNLLHGAVPYAMAPGNHDSSSGDYNTFNARFPVSKFINFSWYGDGYNNRNHNSYELFSTNGMDFIIIHLAYNPDSSERSWASQILNYYPNHRAIISTHSFLDDDGRTTEGNNIWSDVIKNHDNVFMVVCGHMHYQRYFVYKNNFGHNVHCLLTDYQDDNPQIAKLRYYTFRPGENAVYAYTYSTHKKQSYTDSGSQFKFTYAMTGSSSGSVYPKDFPSANGGDILRTNQALNLNQYLVSGNGTYRFYLQGDGNLVLRNMTTSQALWTSGTNGKGGVQLVLQSDGNLVLYAASGSAVWSSMTNGKGGVILSMQSDGNLVLYTTSNTPVWATGTNSGGDDSGSDGTSTDSLDGKIMAGYQGWFMTSNDGSGAGWRHWASSTPNASNITFEMWPDLREYSSSELTPTSFKYANGSNAGLYSAYNATTVDRHVKWMKDYGIDGVFVQRFINEAVNMRSVRDKVLQNVRIASEKHGRVFSNMWDISGGSSSTIVANIKNDWMHQVDNLKITQSSQYLKHKGRPVISIWGFGFSDRAASTVSNCDALIRWFKSEAPEKYRATVMLGVPPTWRGSSYDSVFRKADVISPWTVGRYKDNSGADIWKTNKIAPDLSSTKSSNIDYMPVVFPGFSWWNLKDGSSPFNEIPRKGGQFLWRQFYNAISAGCQMVYVAMYDEVDEGTAIFKIAENSGQIPTTGKFLTLNADGQNLPSNWYLRLTGTATKMLRKEIGLTSTIPITP